MSKPTTADVATALPARRKLGRRPKNPTAGNRIFKVSSIFDKEEWPRVEGAAEGARTTPAGLIRRGLRALGVDVAED